VRLRFLTRYINSLLLLLLLLTGKDKLHVALLLKPNTNSTFISTFFLRNRTIQGARPSQIIFKCTHQRPVAAPELTDWEAAFKASGQLLSFMSCRIHMRIVYGGAGSRL